MINVFIIGARGYTKKYGGWETLVHGLIDNQVDSNIKYHVYEVVDSKNEEKICDIDNVECIMLSSITNKSGYKMIFFDWIAFKHLFKYIKEKQIENPVVLYLGARIGPMLLIMKHRLNKMQIALLENPAGIEWKRPKWGKIAQLYTFISSYLTAKVSDYVISDSEGIRDIYCKMIKSSKPIEEFVAYGSYPPEPLEDVIPNKVKTYFEKNKIRAGKYYLIVNRFMPENSYELILSEYVKSNTDKDLILVTNYETEIEYYEELKAKIPFESDKRIKFVGTMYDTEILNYLRQNAYGYINGHTLGGTNPGLLEAMASTGIVLAYDVVFSREVCGDYAIYYDLKNLLRNAIERCDNMSYEDRNVMIQEAQKRMQEKYSWIDIAKGYERIFREAVKLKGNIK